MFPAFFRISNICKSHLFHIDYKISNKQSDFLFVWSYSCHLAQAYNLFCLSLLVLTSLWKENSVDTRVIQ